MRARRGHGLVCGCHVARLRHDNKTCRCGFPVVARMAPELQRRMAAKASWTVTQKVVPFAQKVSA